MDRVRDAATADYLWTNSEGLQRYATELEAEDLKQALMDYRGALLHVAYHVSMGRTEQAQRILDHEVELALELYHFYMDDQEGSSE